MRMNSCVLGHYSDHWMSLKDDEHWRRKTENCHKVRELLLRRLASSNIAKVFGTFDRDKNGSINRRELAMGLELQGLHLISAEMEELFNRMDGNHDGKISVEEFADFIKSEHGDAD
jgi:hypothetical protein